MAERTNPITPAGFAALRERYEQLFAIARCPVDDFDHGRAVDSEQLFVTRTQGCKSRRGDWVRALGHRPSLRGRVVKSRDTAAARKFQSA